ncbi:MAG: lanthionine synthetase C family protein, partial [Sediminibacterium sp.]|nr:lanthionine synthetase C family protein [Sediminibacterium sp.]
EYLYIQQQPKVDKGEFNNRFESLAENSFSLSFPTFCNGYAGTNWFFKFLNIDGTLKDEDVDLLCYRDEDLKNISLEMLKSGNYDFLHGAIGIAYYLLYNNGNKLDEEYFATFFILLNALSARSTQGIMIPTYDFKINNIKPDEINFGLSHGIPSILKFCLQCYKHMVCKKESKELANRIIEYIISNPNDDITHCYFPYHVTLGKDAEKRTRLAWCYGDLGVSIVLYQAASLFQEKKWMDLALHVLLDSTKRRTHDQTMIVDGSLCHGTAGAAHIYNKMWHYTQNAVFKDASDYWIQKTLELSVYSDGIGGYKKFSGYTKSYENDPGLLEGTAGIGLALLSYLTGDFSWDYTLMLND